MSQSIVLLEFGVSHIQIKRAVRGLILGGFMAERQVRPLKLLYNFNILQEWNLPWKLFRPRFGKIKLVPAQLGESKLQNPNSNIIIYYSIILVNLRQIKRQALLIVCDTSNSCLTDKRWGSSYFF